MPVISGKRAFLELLKQEGVNVLFGNPGTTELPLMDALAAEPDIRYILGLQEAAVMAMADGYAQASGQLTAVSVHVAPGLGNALGMLYNAQKAGSPILVAAGQHDVAFSLTEPLLWADLPTIARPFVKWAYEVRRLEDLAPAVHRAAKTALAPPTGPVFLSLPADVLNAEGQIDLGSPARVAPGIRGDTLAICQAATLIAKAERPLIFAGDALAQAGAHAEIVQLAELVGAPVYAEAVASRASFPASHPLFRGAMTRLATEIRKLLEQHDLVISIGADLFTLSLPSADDPMPETMAIVHIDTDPWELAKNNAPRVAILGEPKTTLPELIVAIAGRLTPEDVIKARERTELTKAAIAAELATLKQRAQTLVVADPIHPLALLYTIAEALPPDAVIVEEALSSGAGIRQLFKSDDPQSFYGLRGGGIGWGLSAAVGIKLALPDRPVIALIGDGSAMYTIQALWTAANQQLAVIFVILNNSSYNILKQRSKAMKGHAADAGVYVGMDLTDPAIDFVEVARGLGVAGARATTLAQVKQLLAAGREQNGPSLIDVQIARI